MEGIVVYPGDGSRRWKDKIPLATLSKKIVQSKEIQNELNELKDLGKKLLGADSSTEDLEAWITGIEPETDILLTDNDIVDESLDKWYR